MGVVSKVGLLELNEETRTFLAGLENDRMLNLKIAEIFERLPYRTELMDEFILGVRFLYGDGRRDKEPIGILKQENN